MYNLCFKHPFTGIIQGGTSSGKTFWLLQFLREIKTLVDPVPKNVILCYSEMQDIYRTMMNENLVTEMIQGLPELEDLKEKLKLYKQEGAGTLLILDDLMNNCDMSTVESLFVRLSHHTMCSVWFITQSLFMASKQYRCMSLNAMYILLFKNPRENRQIYSLAQQVFPYRTGYVVDAFRRATRLPYNPLLMDFRQDQSDAVRLRTNLLSTQKPPIVFLQKSS
jgi:hypothetical protein